MSNTNHDFIVKNGLVVGSAITSTGTLTQAGQTFPASDGSANQYLKTNGSGALSWGTVNTSFNITDGTTTDAVGLTETVTFTGGTNISLAVTDNTVTITNDVTDTDDITEGSSNLFYTDTRAVDAVEGHAHLTIDGGTLYVDTANNYVGIGDTSPSGKLDVAGNIMINGSEVINASGSIVGAVADSAMTVGGSLAGVLSNLKVQYGTAYSGTPIQGSFFFDSLNQKLKVYTGSAFIDAVPAGSGGGGGGGATDANTTFRNYSYTLTGTTSAVSGVDDNELTAGAFIIGHKYTITATGNTNFVTIGAANSNVNTVFTATGVGTGTGTAKQTLFYDTTSSATRVVAYVNGIKQVYGSGRDFVATTGTSVAFTYNLGSGDTVDLQVYELLTNAAYYLKSETLATTAVNSNIATAVADYLPLAGGTMTGDINFADGDKVQFGADADLQIYHNGANSIIQDNGTGNIRIQTTNTVEFGDQAFNETFAEFNDDGAVNLYHNNVLKVATTAAGATVTGTVTATSFVGSGAALTGISGASTSFVTYSSAPSVGAAGSVYYNTSSDTAFISDGSSWNAFTNLPPEPTAGTQSLSGQDTIAFTSHNIDNDFSDDSNLSSELVYSLFSGSLPPGITISGNLLSGTPTSAGSYTFGITATDTNGAVGSAKNYSFTVIAAPFSASGGTVYTSGGYKYHKFTSSGTLSVTGIAGAPNAEVLMIAGGGGGGRDDYAGGRGAGGGGAGGLIAPQTINNMTSSLTIVIGGGGTNSGGNGAAGTQGGNTTVTGLTTAIGGGGGGSHSTASNLDNDTSGGSGGGASNGRTGSAGTSGQGNSGGNGAPSGPYGGGGGGGKNQSGASSNNGAANGGNGTNSYNVWASATSSGDSGHFAGGGAGGGKNAGGGAGGAGGGGDANNGPGQVNTGGGGGGNYASTAGSGGSGIVIIRYPV